MNLAQLRVFASFLLNTLMVLFIGTYFGLDLPLDTLLQELKQNLIIAIPAGIVLAAFQEWTIRKSPRKEQ
jgi:hypothetical protein